MSEPQLISPLLDGFTMGQSMGEHDGVSCCPAIKEDTDKKYIVKIITVPASQVQLDALLLAGAYKDPADAMAYFRQICEDIIKEAELLKELSRLEGFLSYESWQLEPITRKRLGYQVYLVGSYKRSLERHLRRNPVTHLEAINLGLDLCSALSVCRQAGSVYVALKPANIFVSDKKQYRIGDLGFVSLDALSYTALPKKYQSQYTPPELFDPMSALNLTVDTYAVGMILYQLYNDGQLPFRGKAPEEPLPSPVNADYELAEIIMKAIHPDPQQRWEDPAAMGKALAAYMQRNAVNDTPITPHTPLDLPSQGILETLNGKAEAIPPEPDPQPGEPEAAAASQPEVPSPAEPEIPAESGEIPPEPEPLPQPDLAELPPVEQPPEPAPEIPEPSYEADTPIEETELPDVPLELPVESEPESPRDEFAGILAKAEDLISHTPPEGVILPEIPEAPDPFAFAKEDGEDTDDAEIPQDPLMEEEPEPSAKKKKPERKYADPKYKKRTKRLIGALTFLLALCLAGLAAFWYYQNIYLQAIYRIAITGTKDQLTVTVDSEVPDAKLMVTCSDSHGLSQSQTPSGGTVIFTDLSPSTLYTIQLDVDGFHKLVGKTSDIFTTDATTNILSFTSLAGAEDGSVLLNFTVEGEEPDSWTLRYSAENEDVQELTFEGHSVSVAGLSVGKKYTFTLDAGSNLTLGGEKSIQLMAARLILAENVTASSTGEGELNVHWDSPGDVVVDSWTVRCYNNAGYDEKKTVTESEAMFVGIDPATSYTVEVVAAGMTQPSRISITENPIRISQIQVDDANARKLSVSWDYAGSKPEGGWLLLYTVDGDGRSVVKCNEASAEITPRIPGAKYAFTLQAADGTSVLGGNSIYTAPEAQAFNQFQFSADTLQADLVKTPAQDKWYSESLGADAFSNTFASGDSISIALRNSESFYLPGSEVEILYVIRDAYGNVLPDFVSAEKVYWKNIWLGGDSKNGELRLPKVPTNSGSYVLNLYIEGLSMAELPFTIQ